jgi:hypothetical protein
MDRTTILLQAVEVVKSFGYRCFFPRYASTFVEKPTYCYITDGTNIGYMQSNDWGCALSFSSVHKPSRENGMGCGIADNVLLKDITKELIERTFGTPKWVKTKPIKYASWEDYTKNSLTGKICKEIVEL